MDQAPPSCASEALHAEEVTASQCLHAQHPSLEWSLPFPPVPSASFLEPKEAWGAGVSHSSALGANGVDTGRSPLGRGRRDSMALEGLW